MAPTPNHITPARIFVTSGADTYYAIDPVHIADYLAQVRHPASFIGKANSFRVTSDGQPGVGYILLTRANLDAMDRSLSNYSITFKTVGVPAPAGEVVISNLHITNAIAVAGTIRQLPSDIYLVEFKDRIDYTQLTSLNKGYNIRTPDWVSSTDFFNDSQNAGAAWTWATMLADIWTNISPIAGALTTTLVSFPTSNPDNFANFGMNAWDAALHVCHSTHNRLVCARAGTFHAISEGAADATNITYMTLARTNKILLNPSDPKSRTKTSIPEKVRVFFTKRNTAFQNSTDADVVTGTEQWRTDPTIAYTITSSAVVPALAATGTITNAIYPIYDSMVAVYNELGTLQNGAALQTQAESRATAYINSINVYEDARDDLYNGAVPFEIGPNFDCIHWYDFGDGVRTQTFSSSPKKSGGTADNQFTTLTNEWPSLPDLSRQHMPFEKFAVGEVYGATIEAGGSGLVRVQYGTRTSATVTTWADTALPHEVRAHDIYEKCYTVGTRVFMGFMRQPSRWVIICAELDNPKYGSAILTYDLCGTTGAADINTFAAWIGLIPCVGDAATPTTAINTFKHRGMAGDRVFVVWSNADNAYVIIDVEKHPYKVYTDLRQTGDCVHWCVEGYGVTAALEVCDTPAWETLYCNPCAMYPETSVLVETSTGDNSYPTYGCCVGGINLDLGITHTDENGSHPAVTDDTPLFATINSTGGCIPGGFGLYNPREWDINHPEDHVNYNPNQTGQVSMTSYVNGGTYDGDPAWGIVTESWHIECVRRINPMTGALLFPDDPSQREWRLVGTIGHQLNSNAYGFTLMIFETGVAIYILTDGYRALTQGSLTVHSCDPFHATATFVSLGDNWTDPEGGTGRNMSYPTEGCTISYFEITE